MFFSFLFFLVAVVLIMFVIDSNVSYVGGDRRYQSLNFDGLFSSLGHFARYQSNRGRKSSTCTEGEKLKCLIQYFEVMRQRWNTK